MLTATRTGELVSRPSNYRSSWRNDRSHVWYQQPPGPSHFTRPVRASCGSRLPASALRPSPRIPASTFSVQMEAWRHGVKYDDDDVVKWYTGSFMYSFIQDLQGAVRGEWSGFNIQVIEYKVHFRLKPSFIIWHKYKTLFPNVQIWSYWCLIVINTLLVFILNL